MTNIIDPLDAAVEILEQELMDCSRLRNIAALNKDNSTMNYYDSRIDYIITAIDALKQKK